MSQNTVLSALDPKDKDSKAIHHVVFRIDSNDYRSVPFECFSVSLILIRAVSMWVSVPGYVRCSLRFQAGDHVGVFPSNDPALVSDLVKQSLSCTMEAQGALLLRAWPVLMPCVTVRAQITLMGLDSKTLDTPFVVRADLIAQVLPRVVRSQCCGDWQAVADEEKHEDGEVKEKVTPAYVAGFCVPPRSCLRDTAGHDTSLADSWVCCAHCRFLDYCPTTIRRTMANLLDLNRQALIPWLR